MNIEGRTSCVIEGGRIGRYDELREGRQVR